MGCQDNRTVIALSFDDDFAEQWHDHIELFAEYDATATFFVTRFGEMSSDEIDMLVALQDAGHEIGAHGLTHDNPSEYISGSTPDAYIDDIVVPELELMEPHGFSPTSYAYPWGGDTPELEDALLDHFEILRDSATINFRSAIFYEGDGDRTTMGARIDHGHATRDEIRSLMAEARDEKKGLLLYAHWITEESEQGFIHPDELEAVLEDAAEYDLRFINMTDLLDWVPEGS